MFCPKCGTRNIDEARFCGACGTPLDANAGMPAPQTTNAFAPAPQVARVQPSAAPGGKNVLPLLIAGAAAGFIVVVLIAAFVVVPAFSKNPFKGCQVGDVVEFGSYEQDGNASNGKEPIEWRVLAVEGNRAYVVSQKALDAHAFNADEDDGNDWNSSDLKKWLENDFASQAFAGDEMKEISGAPTLLSIDEANKYFMSDRDRQCCPTDRLKQQWGWDLDDNDACDWRLRSPSVDSYDAAGVSSNGYVNSDGLYVVYADLAVRPALWVNL